MSLPDLTLPIPTRPSGLMRNLTALSAALAALSLLWALGDGRLVDGAPVWLKPLKFSVSFVVLFATMALVEDRMSDRLRTGWVYHGIGLAMGTAMIVEMAYMVVQAARGVASHFNYATPFELFMYQTVMGGGALTLVLAVGLTGWLVARDREADFGPATRAGIFWGFVLSCLLTLVVAGYMSSTSRWVGSHPEGGPTLPLLGWSGVVGDLRPAHFASLHGMQALPLLGLWLDRRGRADGPYVIRWAALGWVALTAALFVQALLGLPLIRLG